ncbi:MAG TPA: hypothetical protein VFQ65_26240 [Kofleriaceae bacterium]|nr:hypothetical protein [Kofleriaceae bacterium]
MLSTQTSSSTTPRTSLFTLDTLAQRSHAELDALYRAASVSKSMHAADGALVGRMLAVKGLPGTLATPLRRWAGSSSFVWEGKSFEASSDTHGMGFNRVNAAGVLGRQNLFPFATAFGPSAIDGKPTLILDYDLAVNPGYIRHVHDEIREVSAGVFLGPAMWKRGADKIMILWFALDATHAARSRPS